MKITKRTLEQLIREEFKHMHETRSAGPLPGEIYDVAYAKRHGVDPEGITGKTTKTADPRMRHHHHLGVETQQLKNAEKVYSKAQYVLMQAQNLEKAIGVLASQSGLGTQEAVDAKEAIEQIMVVAPYLLKALGEQALKGGQSGGGEQQTRFRTTEVPASGGLEEQTHITRKMLKRIIKEELADMLYEASPEYRGSKSPEERLHGAPEEEKPAAAPVEPSEHAKLKKQIARYKDRIKNAKDAAEKKKYQTLLKRAERQLRKLAGFN